MVNRNKKSLVKNSIFNAVYNMLNIVFPLVTTMYVSRILSPDGIGRVAYAKNITSYFVTFALMGLPTYGVREIARVRDDPKLCNRLFTQLFVLNAITTTIFIVIYVDFVQKNVFEVNKMLLICTGIQLFFNYFNIDWFYQGMEEYVYIVCRSSLIKIISLIAIFMFVKNKNDYIVYALMSSFALVGNYTFNIINVKKYVHIDFTKFIVKCHVKPLMILGVAVFFSTIYTRLDITMLGYMKSSSDVGIYSNAVGITNVVLGMCASISAVFLPRLSYYYNIDKDKFNSLINTGIRIISFFSIPVTVGLIMLSKDMILIIYGIEFLKSAEIVEILSILIVIKGFGDLLCYQLAIATGHEKDRLLAYVGAAVLNSVLNFILIPYIGCTGAAIASVLSELSLNVIQYYKMKKLVDYTINIKSIIQALVSSIIMGVSIYGIQYWLKDGNLFIRVVCSFMIGSLVYFFLNVFMKNELTEEVKKYLCSLKSRILG